MSGVRRAGGNQRTLRLSGPSMSKLRSVVSRALSGLAVAAQVACARGSRADGAGSVGPGEAAGTEAPELARSEPTPPDAATELARARLLHALALAEGDAAEQARARFALAEAYAIAAAGLDVARFDLQDQRVAGSARPDLERREAELLAQQQAWLDAAAHEYAELLRATDPTAVELRPRARYGLADVERRRGDRRAMHDALVTLVHDDPTHSLASAALVALADEAFEGGRLEEARSLYEQVVVRGGDERYYARYKLGWVALALDDAQAALAHWTSVATETRMDPRQRALAENAAKDCVIAYARVGRPEKARAFFRHIDPTQADRLVRRLAETYEHEGRSEDAARALGSTGP